MTTKTIDMAKLDFRLTKAKTAIALDHPFWASLMYRKPIAWDTTIPTACVSWERGIRINPAFAEPLSVQQLVFLVAHEIGHLMYNHTLRLKERDRRKWNVAGDAVINDLLKDQRIGEFIPGVVDMPGSKDKYTELVYSELPDGGDGPGGTGEDLAEEGSGLSEAEVQRIEAEVKVAVAQAAATARIMGKLHGKLADIVQDLLEVKIPWFDKLERYMVGFTKGDYSWKRPNRRYAPDHYLPSTGQVARMGPVVLQIDVSGSISEQELRLYESHFVRICELCRPEKIHVIYTDTDVLKVEEFDEPENVRLEMIRGGGTDMTAGYNWVDQQGIDPDVFVCMTDGYTPFGDAQSYPTVWCISQQSITAPHGETIYIGE